MIKEMKIPSPGESITEVEIATWLVENGDYVELDQPIAEIDSDKATLELPAEFAGTIELLVEEGETVEVGQIVCKIDTSAKAPEGAPKKKENAEEAAPKKEEAPKQEKAAPAKPVAIDNSVKATPVAKEMMQQNNISGNAVKGSGNNGKITKADIEAYISGGIDTSYIQGWGGTRMESREKMSMLRRKVACLLPLTK
jgi:2-oxoglutarate dehydrogenase E2 component (dihydrolipoamide succinyltransferase)